jgi:hypothetical protein
MTAEKYERGRMIDKLGSDEVVNDCKKTDIEGTDTERWIEKQGLSWRVGLIGDGSHIDSL